MPNLFEILKEVKQGRPAPEAEPYGDMLIKVIHSKGGPDKLRPNELKLALEFYEGAYKYFLNQAKSLIEKAKDSFEEAKIDLSNKEFYLNQGDEFLMNAKDICDVANIELNRAHELGRTSFKLYKNLTKMKRNKLNDVIGEIIPIWRNPLTYKERTDYLKLKAELEYQEANDISCYIDWICRIK